VRSDQDRIKSIKDHFDALTAMTPEDYNSERTVNADSKRDGNSGESEESEEDSNVMLDAYTPDPGKVRPLRGGFKKGQTEFKKKRKLELQNEKHVQSDEKHNSNVSVKLETPENKGENELSKRSRMDKTDTASIDYENADFSQFTCGVKQGKSKQFNPWKESNNKGKMNQKGKTGFKGRNKTFHYKKSK